MKNIILMCAGLLYSVYCFSQGATKVTIHIPQADSASLQARIFIEDPLQPINNGFFKDTMEIRGGQCQFLFDIKNTSLMTLFINNKYITMPGLYSVLIEPNDSLVFDLPPINEAGFFGFGIAKVDVSGKGREKINLTKNIINSYVKLSKADPEYQKQSLTYKYEAADRKLHVIDSLYRSELHVSSHIKDLVKAQLYGNVLQMLFRSSKRSENDSLRMLFDKYIVKKNRMEVFLKKDVVQYGGILGSYLILSEFKNPVKVNGEFFQKEHSLEYAEILVRRLNTFPEIRDYLLSAHLITTILKGFDSTTTKLYHYYLDKADFDNPNFNNVVNTYEETERKFAVGKPFYDFHLPDSTGKIYSLKDFKGKVLLFDFWFNGCSGCKTMVPVLEQIEKELSGKNVQFVSIGIDKRQTWLAGIGKYSCSNSLQLYTNEQTDNHPMIKYLNIYGYPRLIIVDKKGNISAAPFDPRISKKQFIEQIESLL